MESQQNSLLASRPEAEVAELTCNENEDLSPSPIKTSLLLRPQYTWKSIWDIYLRPSC